MPNYECGRCLQHCLEPASATVGQTVAFSRFRLSSLGQVVLQLLQERQRVHRLPGGEGLEYPLHG